MIDTSLVKESTLVADGIDYRDAPDYCDAYFSYGEFYNGDVLTDDQLERLTEMCPDVLYDVIINTIY